MKLGILSLALFFLSGCAGIAPEGVLVALYERTGEAFLMITREDGECGNTTWGQGSGVAVEDGGWHFIYTARHVVFDKTNYDALPNKLYVTTLQGENHAIDLSKLEVPDDNHDAVRIELQKSICRELRLANRKPRYGETLFVFGDARGAGVICADAGKVVAIGPLEFEQNVDTIDGMSGGPVVDCEGNLVGLAKKDGRQRHRKLVSRSRAIPDIFDYVTSLRHYTISNGENSFTSQQRVNSHRALPWRRRSG